MINNSRWLQVLIIELVIIAALFLVQQIGAFLMQFVGIWLLFFLSWLLAFALRPLIRTLGRSPIPHPLAVLIVYIGLILVFVGVGVIIFPQLTNQLTDLQQNWTQYAHQANNLVIELQNWVQKTTGQNVDLNRLYQEATSQLQAQAGTIIGSAVTWLSTAASLLFNVILVILISLYIALDGDRLGNSMIKALPIAWRDEATLLGESIGRSFGGFLRGQLIFALVYAVFNAIIMGLFGLNYVIIASIIAGFCMLIPLVGNFLAYIPAVLVALLDPIKPWWLVLIVMFIMQSLMMQVVGPRIMSSAVGIHPLFTVMAMLLGAQVMGIWGALFGIPVAGVIGLVSNSFFNRLKEFFNAPETTPILGVVVAPATGPLDSLPDPSPLQPAPVARGAAAPAPPSLTATVRSSALLRGLTRLTSAARRSPPAVGDGGWGLGVGGMMRKIKLMAEYGCDPLWDITEPIPDTPSAQALGLSRELQERLAAWSDRFQATLDPEYPPDSGFLTPLDLADFEAEGRALVAALQTELGPGVIVSYCTDAGVREDALPRSITG